MKPNILVHELAHAAVLSTLTNRLIVVRENLCQAFFSNDQKMAALSAWVAIAAQTAFEDVKNASPDSRFALIIFNANQVGNLVQIKMAGSKSSDADLIRKYPIAESDQHWLTSAWQFGALMALREDFDSWAAQLPQSFRVTKEDAQVLMAGNLPAFTPLNVRVKMPVPTLEIQ
jgi:hypothetical protein